AEHRGHSANPVYVPVSRADIGDYLGLTTETVSRTFTQLKSSGTIRLLDGHRVDLKGREELQSIAEGG
ncbi:helix-turn-helix domain-containing protein, partial [Paraburkholderia sp. SIMBA_061]